MPTATTLSMKTPARASLTATFAASAAVSTEVQASMQIPVGAPSVNLNFVPASEVWYITNFYLPPNVTPSAVHAYVFPTVNLNPQRINLMEDEIQQSTQNPLKLSTPVQLEPGAQFYFTMVNTVANGSSSTTVTIYAAFLMVPLR